MMIDRAPIPDEHRPFCDAMESLCDHLDAQAPDNFMPYAMKGNPQTGTIAVVPLDGRIAAPPSWMGFSVDVREGRRGALATV